jgi:TetR/AcrR family transcriptional regulator, transcriptional repressor for nem operon
LFCVVHHVLRCCSGVAGYAAIAAELGITKAALHYHLAGKADLDEALIVRYASRFAEALDGIDATADGSMGATLQIRRPVAGRAAQPEMCLCGMLAAEYQRRPRLRPPRQ